MSEAAICVEGLGKKYRIGEKHERYKTLRDTLADAAFRPFRAIRSWIYPNGDDHKSSDNIVWALRDVSFDIKRGEVVGVIGRNGAGKSTLLKILSCITEPTEGHADIHGRVGSLLEVGTGFHPELTGRENIYLNGAILGMKKAEIDRKFDEIVAFAEVEKFIDTPVKHYSSGMHVRLAFAVAAHLEPEILLVDEVLAVGDLAFQQKCLGKMGDVARGGRTILFVTHQMNQIRRLCERCIWLDGGRVRRTGPTAEAVSAYEAAMISAGPARLRGADRSTVAAKFIQWEVVSSNDGHPNVLTNTGQFSVKFVLEVNKALSAAAHGVALLRDGEQTLWGTGVTGLKLGPGVYNLVYTLPHLFLQPGIYHWRVSLHDDHGLVDIWDCVPEFIIATQPMTHFQDEYAGILNLPYDFRMTSLGECLKTSGNFKNSPLGGRRHN
jgi:lipopolysaccharide transport system ATP-binding protein